LSVLGFLFGFLVDYFFLTKKPKPNKKLIPLTLAPILWMGARVRSGEKAT
jgi:hypothetical protein